MIETQKREEEMMLHTRKCETEFDFAIENTLKFTISGGVYNEEPF